MGRYRVVVPLLASWLACLLGAAAAFAEPGGRALPELGTAEKPADGVLLHKVSLATEDGKGSRQVWVYTPAAPAGKVPCVLIAPAGTRLFHGMELGEGDMPEHLPYVAAGWVVVAYEISGRMSEEPADLELVAAGRAFLAAEGGVADAKRALDFALARVPSIDPERVFAAGHSSAATLALQVAAFEPRVKGCIAFAPAPDLAVHFTAEGIGELEKLIPGFRAYVDRCSPHRLIERLRAPLFLFHAQDDDVVEPAALKAFAAEVRKGNPQVTESVVPEGGHYDAMVGSGIPRAIEWIRGRAGGKK